jgi:phosphomethylpyrimidine synthase
MKITQDVRDYARDKGLEEESALHQGMAEKAEEFVKQGAEVYRRA